MDDIQKNCIFDKRSVLQKFYEKLKKVEIVEERVCEERDRQDSEEKARIDIKNIQEEDSSIVRGILCKEWRYIKNRKEKLKLLDNEISAKMAEPENKDITPPFDTFGVALSGGGVRSATFSLGVLCGFAQKGIFKNIDYLSTVSGGGYTGAYIEHRIRELEKSDSDMKNYEKEIFHPRKLIHLKNFGDYLRSPGDIYNPIKRECKKFFTISTFYIANFLLALMHIFWYIALVVALLIALETLGNIFGRENIENFSLIFLYPLIVALFFYYFFHGLRHISRDYWPEKWLFYCMSFSLLLFLLPKFFLVQIPLDDISPGMVLIYIVAGGFFANPNILSSHRFYRWRLQEAFLEGSHIKLHQIDAKESIAPYHLINTTLNIQSDKNISGQKSCDYFLLSPYYCGSKLTNYASTKKTAYKNMSYATAITISGAALNPQMGFYSNRFLAFLMTLFNLRLGYWALNPLVYDEESLQKRGIFTKIVVYLAKKDITLWPWYNLAELFGISNLERIRINLSDGGHIENLGVFELLRRRCSLIVSIDGSADPDYRFDDLKNLIVRARNELEIVIEFDEDQDPQKVIAPDLQTGFSQRSYAVATMYELPKEGEKSKKFIGYFVYIKACVTAQKSKLDPKDRKNAFYSYKNYHPKFPHEPTTDQFFDKNQWKAYFYLGRYICEDLLENIDEVSSLKILQCHFASVLRDKKLSC